MIDIECIYENFSLNLKMKNNTLLHIESTVIYKNFFSIIFVTFY